MKLPVPLPLFVGLLVALGAGWVALTHFVLFAAFGLPVWAVLSAGFLLLLPPILVYGRATDRLHRAAADRAVGAAHLRLRLLLSHLPAVVWTVDRDLRFTSARGRGLRDLGVDEDDVVGSTVPELFAREGDDFPLLRGCRDALGGVPGTYDLAWSARSWKVRIEPIRDGDEVVGVVGAAMDVTDEEDVRQRLEEQRAHLRQLFDESPEGIVLVDERDVVLDANAEFQRMYGYTRAEVLGRPVNDLIVPEGRFAEAVALTRRVAEGEKVETEAVRRRKDGSLVDVSILATPVDLGDKRRIYGIYRDITQQKATELQLLHSQRLEAVGQLAGGVAHDFNNILTVILGQAHTLLEEAKDEQFRTDLAQIEAAATRAANLTRQLLTFSRRDMVSVEPVNLDAFIEDTRDFLERTIGDRIELVTDLAGDLPFVRADPGQLQQVVMNLLINSRDAMADGGRVVVRTRVLQPDGSAAHNGGDGREECRSVVLEVEDTGCGMTDEEVARIFEPFFTTKPRGRGTGLGMSTVYGIVERSGGTIEVDTVKGEGTTFRIRLPAMAEGEAVPEPEPPRPPRKAPPRDYRAVILLVDDDAPVLEIARIILERRGYRVVTADSGAAGLRMALGMEHSPDLLLTDLVMPGMSGQKLADEIRAKWPELRTLFMTGHTDGQWAREFELRPQGGRDILQKPFDPNTLVRRVREILARD